MLPNVEKKEIIIACNTKEGRTLINLLSVPMLKPIKKSNNRTTPNMR